MVTATAWPRRSRSSRRAPPAETNATTGAPSRGWGRTPALTTDADTVPSSRVTATTARPWSAPERLRKWSRSGDVMSADGGSGEYADGRGGEDGGPRGDNGDAERCHPGWAAHAPDVVQPGAVLVEQPVAHDSEGVGERQNLGDGREPRGKSVDGEQGPGEEPRE